MNREEAFTLLKEYLDSDSLIKHSLSVEACMNWYARSLNEDVEKWSITGLLHDFDYEKYPDPEQGGHPYAGNKILKDLNVDPEICEAIMGHALYTNVPRNSLMAKYLFACDELSGLVYACVLVRPDRDINNLEVKSVKKKLKDKAFARGVSREDISLGLSEIGLDLDLHISNVIAAMRENKDNLF